MFSNLKQRYNSLNLQVKVVFWFTVSAFFASGISLLFTPIFTRVLTTDEYGLYSVFNSWNTVLMVVATLNLHLTAVYNALTKHPNEQEQTISYFQSLSLCISVAICIVALIFSEQLANLMDLPQIVVQIMFIGFIFVEPYRLWLVYKRYKNEYKRPVIMQMTLSVVTPAVSLLCIFLGHGNRGIIRVIAFVVVNTIVPGIIFYIVNYRHAKCFYNKRVWGYATSFAVPLIPHYLAETLLNQTDKIMINAYFGASEAGIYQISYMTASIVKICSTAINSAYIPWQFQKLYNKEYKKLGRISYVVLLGLLVVVLLVSLFAPEIVRVLAGPKYMGAVYLIPTLSVSVFFNYMYQLFARVEMYCEKKRYTVFATITAAILNIVLNILFMPIYGYTFAGISTLISHIWFVAIHYIFYRRTCKKCLDGAKIYDGKIIGLISVIAIALAIGVTFTYNFLWLRIGILAFIVILAVIFRKKIMSFARTLMRR